MSINGSTPVRSAGLSTRATNTLARAGFSTLEEVARADRGAIGVIPNLGVVTLAEIDRALAAAGLGELEFKPELWPQRVPTTRETADAARRAARGEVVRRMRLQGATLREIATYLGVSPQRAHQLWARIATPAEREAVAAATHERKRR